MSLFMIPWVPFFTHENKIRHKHINRCTNKDKITLDNETNEEMRKRQHKNRTDIH